MVVLVRPDEDGVDEEGGEASDENGAAGYGEEAAAGVVRIPGPGPGDVNRLDQRCRLAGHLVVFDS
jgi:hypothetical protein